MKTSVRNFSSVTFVDAVGEKTVFLWARREREKSQRENAWCNTTKWLTFPRLVCHLRIGVVRMSTATPSALCRRWQKEMCAHYRKAWLQHPKTKTLQQHDVQCYLDNVFDLIVFSLFCLHLFSPLWHVLMLKWLLNQNKIIIIIW